jgi:hypothetical protein
MHCRVRPILVASNAIKTIDNEIINQGWIYWGGGGGGGGGGVGGGGVLFFMIKQKIIRDKMRYSNLSNNMMISEL